MYSVEDILAMLNKGEDPEKIAQTFADSLNQAIDQKKKAEEEAKKKAQAEAEAKKLQEAQKRAWLQDILDEMYDWFCECYPDYGFQEALKAEEVMPMLDETMESVKALNKLFEKVPVEKKNKKSVSADQAIADFLKMFDL